MRKPARRATESARDELPEQLPAILGLLKDLARQPSGLDYLHTLLRYLSRGTDRVDRTELARAVTQTFERGDEIMNTIAAEWIKEGELKGKLEGELRGRKQEAEKLLQRLLTRRFGPLPAWVEDKLTQADTETLEMWADRVLDAPTLEAVAGEEPPVG